jgi:hypothetical protein
MESWQRGEARRQAGVQPGLPARLHKATTCHAPWECPEFEEPPLQTGDNPMIPTWKAEEIELGTHLDLSCRIARRRCAWSWHITSCWAGPC